MSKGKREMSKREGCRRFTQVDNWLLLSRGMLFVQMLMVLGSERDDQFCLCQCEWFSYRQVLLQECTRIKEGVGKTNQSGVSD